jgi:hypothetical protein
VSVSRHAVAACAAGGILLVACQALGAPLPGGSGTPSTDDAARIEALTGAKGDFDAAEGVFKVSYPRSDLAVSVGGARMTPPLGLTSWAAFKQAGAHAMVMGDMVLTEDQVAPVMSAALDAGLDVTALHNHFAGDSPRVMFMHIGGMGDRDALAAAVGSVFSRIRETAGGKGEMPRSVNVDPSRTALDAAALDGIFGTKGTLAKGVYKVTIGRETAMDGVEVGKAMGVNTWAAMAGTDQEAIVDGDFAVLAAELTPVLKSLRSHGIFVVAIHNHMTAETPRIVFLHYWGAGKAMDLAGALRAALDRTGTGRR